jgi:hypothetical protein
VEALTSGTGSSTLDDARAAGREAAATALGSLGQPAAEDPALVLVYASVRYDLAELLAGVRSLTGAAPLAGFTSCGHFAGPDVTEPGRGVIVLVLHGGDYSFGLASVGGLKAGAEAAGITLARAAKAAAKAADGSAERPYAAMVLFTDGLGIDQQGVLTGVHRVGGASVPVVGGAAADDWKMQATHVFHDDQVLDDAAVGIWISSSRPLTVASAHGWTPVSLPLLITRSDGLVIHEIGGRPANEVFREFATQHSEKPTQESGFNWQATFALGLIEPDGSHLIRGVTPTQDGPIHSFTPLPAYSAVQVMTADPDALLSVIDGVVADAMGYGDETLLLAFDCIARMDIMGDQYPDEVAKIVTAAGRATCFGTYTYGEFGRSKGVGGVHNSTLTALAL